MSTSKSSKNPQPISEEAISKRAYELWEAQGRCSNPDDDWNEAKRQLEQEQAQGIKVFRRLGSLLNQPLILVEKRFFEPCADWFERAAIFQIVEKLSPIIEAVGVIMIPIAIWWFTETNEELKERQEKATRGQQAVQSYLNQISNILLQGGIEKLEKNEELRNITRASTLALLQNPDLQHDSEEQQIFEEDRKGQVISYLSETNLIQSLKLKGKSKPPIISLKKANLEKANLSNADLEGANLEQANLLGTKLFMASLEQANLKRAILNEANMRGAILVKTNLNEAFLVKADLERANLEGANLNEAFVDEAFLVKANLERANLEQASLNRANLQGANLEGANLKRANLQGANLEGANLKQADLKGAKYTDKNTKPEVCKVFLLKHPCPTKFTPKFNPQAADMTLINNRNDLR